MTEIESYIVDRARKRVQKRREKEARRNGSGVVGEYGMNGNANGLETRDDVDVEMNGNRNDAEMNGVSHQSYQMEVPKLASFTTRHTSPEEESNSSISKIIWSSSPGINFIGAASLSSIDIQSNGTLSEQFQRMYSIQTIDTIRRGPANVITIMGMLANAIVDGQLAANSPSYTLVFSLLENEETRALDLH